MLVYYSPACFREARYVTYVLRLKTKWRHTASDRWCAAFSMEY